MISSADTVADVGFILRQTSAAPGSRILDVPCGTGRHVVELARRGYVMDGIDVSPDAIERARAAARQARVSARFSVADMRDMPVCGPFAGAICLGNSASYFDAKDTQIFFNMLGAALAPNGWLVLDSYSCAESIFPLEKRRELVFDGGSYHADVTYDPRTSMLKTRGFLTLGEDSYPVINAHRVMTSGELVRGLAAVGLRTTGMFADTDGTPYAPGSPRLLLTAVRSY